MLIVISLVLTHSKILTNAPVTPVFIIIIARLGVLFLEDSNTLILVSYKLHRKFLIVSNLT